MHMCCELCFERSFSSLSQETGGEHTLIEFAFSTVCHIDKGKSRPGDDFFIDAISQEWSEEPVLLSMKWRKWAGV